MPATVRFENGNYSITGTYDDVTIAVEKALGSYPTPGYGTWFNWPPQSKKGFDGKVVTHLAAIQNPDGTWTALGHRSSSCD